MHIEALTEKGKEELGATKAYTIGRRGELKDYVDMYYLLQGGQCSLDGIARMAYEKYGDIFDKRLFLEQLLYFDDIEDTLIQFLMPPVDKETLKRFFEDEIQKIEI